MKESSPIHNDFTDQETFIEAQRKSPIKVTDEFYQTHTLEKVLSSGGQGMVFRTSDPELLVKLCFQGSKPEQHLFVSEQMQKDALNEKFLRIGLLPTPTNLSLALPLASIQQKAGYVMRFAGGMEEFGLQFIMQNPKEFLSKLLGDADMMDNMPAWLKGFFNSEHQKNQGKGNYQSIQYLHYLNSGGLRRRLIALSQCASILARLHAQGLVYVDLSPGNAFISAAKEFCHVWMIDADNLRFDGTKGDNYFTPGYGAPEVVTGASSSQLSDCHAFAVMAFYLLSFLHPYEGKAFLGDDGDWADEDAASANYSPEQKKDFGLLAFVDDQFDDSNEAPSIGFPRALIFTPELKQLFQWTLGDGRQQSWRRAQMAHWPIALAQAVDQTIHCSNCGMSYLSHDQQQCPYCDHQESKQIQLIAYQGTDTSQPLWQYQHELSATVHEIPQRVFRPFCLSQHMQAEFIVAIREDSLNLKPLNEDLTVYWGTLAQHQGQFNRLVGELHLSQEMLNAGAFLYVEHGTHSRLVKIQMLGAQA